MNDSKVAHSVLKAFEGYDTKIILKSLETAQNNLKTHCRGEKK